MGIFKKVPLMRPKRSVFNLGHERKFSCNMGQLVPIFCEEVVPGDTFKMNTEILTRLAPMVSPVMHRVNVYTHFFFVPNRLVWDGWKTFITGGDDGNQTAQPPMVALTGSNKALYMKNGSLADYMGVASGADSLANEYRFSALPFRAYVEIYNEYYRDQNLEPALAYNKGNAAVPSADWPTLLTMRKRAWEKDYFTSALPWTQRGGDVSLPLTGNAPIVTTNDGTSSALFRTTFGQSTVPNSDVLTTSGGELSAGGNLGLIDPNGSLEADLSGVTAATVEELRRATKLQQWLERNARGGSRYIEQIMSHFGVKSSDARLQRPEFLGGGKSPIVISEVLQTSSTDATTPQANMAGHGVGVGNTHGFKKFFEEHGFVIGIMSVLPRTAYQQGTRRQFRRFDRFDYYWPEFSQLGEQPVYRDELYSTFSGAADYGPVFGYQSRYADYKYIPDSVHGDFKDSLSFWHMGRIFSAPPALNSTFVQSDPTHRVFAVTDPGEAKLYVQVYNDLKAVRPMPYFNTPSLF